MAIKEIIKSWFTPKEPLSHEDYLAMKRQNEESSEAILARANMINRQKYPMGF